MGPPAPALFSTTSVWPSVGRMASASERATLSVGPPAENGTTILIARSGYSAWAAPAANRAPAASNAESVRGMNVMGSPVPCDARRCFHLDRGPFWGCHQLFVSVENNEIGRAH